MVLVALAEHVPPRQFFGEMLMALVGRAKVLTSMTC